MIALIDGEGNTVVEYTYDSWGKVLGITGSLADTVGVQNPFRYRGYYYDSETGMYYLRSRYYDPGIRRFVNPDKLINDTVLGGNLYTYCENGPIEKVDSDGKAALSVFGGSVASGALSGLLEKVIVAVLAVVTSVAGGLISGNINLPGSKNRTQSSVSTGKALYIPRYEQKISIVPKEKSDTIALTRVPRGQAYFPLNPFDLKPRGLEMSIRVQIGGGKNGGIFQWHIPTSSIPIFEWDEDFRYGPHYHIMRPEWKGEHHGLHYKPGTPIPEPWNTMFF